MTRRYHSDYVHARALSRLLMVQADLEGRDMKRKIKRRDCCYEGKVLKDHEVKPPTPARQSVPPPPTHDFVPQDTAECEKGHLHTAAIPLWIKPTKYCG